MESLERLQPVGCDFVLDVPARNRHWYETGYEPFSSSLFSGACRAADVVIDIGAHVGYYTLLAASRNPRARVIAVEASPDNAAVVARNIELNGAKNVEVINAAFGVADGPVWFEVTEASDNCGLTGHPNSPTIDRVKVDTLVGEDLSIPAGQRLVVKLDIEGHELAALKSLRTVMAQAQETRLLVEYNPRCIRAADQDPRSVLYWLIEHHFRLFAVDEASFVWTELRPGSFDAEKIVTGGYANLMCLPAEDAASVSVVLHSSALSGAERSHIEVVEDLVAAGMMVHSVLPAPDQGLVELARRAGSAVSLVEPYRWWAVDQAAPDLAQTQRYWRSDLAAPQVLDAISRTDPDVVMTQTVVIPQGAIAAAVLGKPHIWWIREFGDLDHFLQLPLEPSKLGEVIGDLSVAVLTNSTAVRSHFFPDDPTAAQVVSPRPSVDQLTLGRDKHRGRFTLGVVGGLHRGKGHSDAVEAVALLGQRGVDLDLVCVGSGTPTDVERLKGLARELGISERVTFTGELHSSSEIYAMLDAVAVTSRSEAFGRVPFEATAAGLPVIYAARGGLLDYMIAGETGLAYEPGRADELANAVERVQNTPELAGILVAEAQRRFQALANDPHRLDPLFRALGMCRDASRSDNPLRTVVGWAASGANDAWTQRDDAWTQRDEALTQRDEALAQRDEALAQRDEALAQRDEALAQRDEALAQRDEALATLSAMQASRSWRWTAGLRRMRSAGES